jgi:hypothetical protein
VEEDPAPHVSVLEQLVPTKTPRYKLTFSKQKTHSLSEGTGFYFLGEKVAGQNGYAYKKALVRGSA